MTEATTTNPLNIREGDVIEYTGENWGPSRGTKETAVRVSDQGIHYKHSGWIEFDPCVGWEYIVHYVARDGDRYTSKHSDNIYTFRGGVPTFPLANGRLITTGFIDPFTSEYYTRLTPEPVKPKLSVKIAPVGADLNDEGSWADITDAIVGGDFSLTPEAEEPKPNLQWVTVPGHKVENGEKVRIPGNLGADFTVENGQIFIAPNVSIPTYSFEELEVLREVIELPTTPGHYESIHEGITFDLDEGGDWTEMNGDNRESCRREYIEDSAPLTRILTQDEANDQKQAALDQQKAQNEAKRKQARKRHDDYQEELLAIIRRRNEENLRLVEQIDELKRELYALRSA